MKKVIYGLMAFSPLLAFAAPGDLGMANTLVQNIRTLLNYILPVLLALAIIYFFWGLIKFIRAAGDPKAASEGKSIMIWGIIAIFIMVAIFGIINWLVGTTGLNNNTITPLPTI